MTLAEYMKANGLKDRDLANALKVGRSYITHLRLGSKTLGISPALKLFNATGQRFGPLAGATPKEIAAVERVTGAA